MMNSTTTTNASRPSTTIAATPTRALVVSACLAIVAALGCGESSYDLWMKALERAGQADRHDCQMAWDPAAKANIVSSEALSTCVAGNEEALSLMKKARDAGFTGAEVDRTIAAREDLLERARSMRQTISYLEHDKAISDRADRAR